jgi:hypothetical protein
MTKYDVGLLHTGDYVLVHGRIGVVKYPHEPQWIDHSTKTWMQEFSGADIYFPNRCQNVYIQAKDIEIVKKPNE